MRDELRSAFSALHASSETISNNGPSSFRPLNAMPGVIYLTAILSEARRRGIDLTAIPRSGAETSCEVRFEAPLCNVSSIALRGDVRVSSPIVSASFRWILVCAVHSASIGDVEAYCSEVSYKRE